jgi:hypothetical protein
MTEECITPLRRRMIEDMSVRHFASKTQHDYIRTVMKLTRFLGRSPDTATNEDLRRFQLHLTENRAGAPIINSTVSALRFFFTVTLGRADAARHLTFVHEPRKLPVVLSPEEVARLLEGRPRCSTARDRSAAYRPATLLKTSMLTQSMFSRVGALSGNASATSKELAAQPRKLFSDSSVGNVSGAQIMWARWRRRA